MTLRWLSAIPVPPDYAPTGTIDDVVPEVRPKFDALIAEAKRRGMNPVVRSAGRTCEQQQEQMRLGYSGAAFCRSMHTIGHAIDLNLTPNTCTTYTRLGEWWESQGGVWGGRWTNFGACGDAGHFHYGFNKAQAVPTSICPSNVTLEQCRQIRRDYLAKAFASGSTSGLSRGGGLSAGALIAGAGLAILLATLAVRGK